MIRGRLFILQLALVFIISPVVAAERGWFLKEMPDIPAVKEEPASAEEEKEIRTLIRNLAKIDAPDYGYCSSANGLRFPPVQGADRWLGHTATPLNATIQTSVTLTKLVEFGPKALPFLLESLDDKTPTRLLLWPPFNQPPLLSDPARILKYLFGMPCFLQTPDIGGIDVSRDVPINPLNRLEARLIRKLRIPEIAQSGIWIRIRPPDLLAADHLKHRDDHVKVGDLCFVAIGQITNREYFAARYQSTGFVMVNSPVHDAKIAESVRAIWSTKEPRRHLLESLWIDFHSRGGDDRGGAQRLQLGAVPRLLHYFPRESEQLVAKRLRELEVTFVPWHEDEDRNGVRSLELLEAVVYTDNPVVRRELLGVFRRSSDPTQAAVIAPVLAKRHDEEILVKLSLFLRALPPIERRDDGTAYRLLDALGKRFRGDVKEAFGDFLKTPSIERRLAVCRVLHEDWGGSLATKLLPSLLNDKREAPEARGLLHAFGGAPDDDSTPAPRICDLAASTLAKHNKKLAFRWSNDHAELDRQLATMRKTLSSR